MPCALVHATCCGLSTLRFVDFPGNLQNNENYIRKLTEQLNRTEERVSALMEFLALAMKNSAMASSGMAGAAEDFLRMGEMMHGGGRGAPADILSLCVSLLPAAYIIIIVFSPSP